MKLAVVFYVKFCLASCFPFSLRFFRADQAPKQQTGGRRFPGVVHSHYKINFSSYVEKVLRIFLQITIVCLFFPCMFLYFRSSVLTFSMILFLIFLLLLLQYKYDNTEKDFLHLHFFLFEYLVNLWASAAWFQSSSPPLI